MPKMSNSYLEALLDVIAFVYH